MILCLLAMYGILIFTGPLWLAGLIIALVIVIVWFNRELFAFFAKNRGVPVAASFIPTPDPLLSCTAWSHFSLGGMIYLIHSRHKVRQPPSPNLD